MKLLCESISGVVLAKFYDTPTASDPMIPTIDSNISNGNIIVTVPETVTVPEAVVRVVFSNSDTDEPTFIIDTLNVENMWISIKKRRQELLKECDWICSVSDYSHSNKDLWIVYRQALRDITKQSNPYKIIWPVPPSL